MNDRESKGHVPLDSLCVTLLAAMRMILGFMRGQSSKRTMISFLNLRSREHFAGVAQDFADIVIYV